MMIVEAPFIGTRTTSRAVVFRDHPAAVPDGAVVLCSVICPISIPVSFLPSVRLPGGLAHGRDITGSGLARTTHPAANDCRHSDQN
jgi:hypothetical protein